MYVAEALQSTIERLDDGFERLGERDTPFTLRAGTGPRETAAGIHEDRPVADQSADELTNEPVTRDVERWADAAWAFDVPFVDTVPAASLLLRAETAARAGQGHGFVGEVTVDGDIADEDVKGQFNPGTKAIRIDAGDVGFLGYAEGPTLAHEVGHAYHVGCERLNDRPGYDAGADDVFATDAERAAAVAISERIRGPIDEPALNGVRSYRRTEPELFADVFAGVVLEPQAARRAGEPAVERVEAVLGALLPRTV